MTVIQFKRPAQQSIDQDTRKSGWQGDVWACECGSEIFRICKSGIYCSTCSRKK